SNTGGGTSPIIANNVLFYAGGGNIRALSPTTGTQLWTSTSTTSNIGSIHWESPIVDNGVLYITDENSHVTAYAPR
ncbi:MAG TPA: PQQ-binding-like beta-propeller repeat protein, partial [Aggregatilineales bacterium]|nr:PQQ-binding-like beta-propeller repeat protein [Aggregatilineales bacterium]